MNNLSKPKKGRMASTYFRNYAPKKGFYVEIGAFDGVSKNSTVILEKNNWEGVCIEANPYAFEKLKNNRKCRCINGALYNYTGNVDFAVMPENKRGWDGIVETLQPRAKKYLDQSEIHKIPCFDFENLNLPYKINYLQIDVEGAELEILNHIDFSKYDISHICIEDNNKILFDNDEYANYMATKNYKLIYSEGVDFLYEKE